MPVTSMSMVDVHDPRLVNPNVMDPLNAYLACQHQPLQIPQVTLTLPMPFSLICGLYQSH
jgi:hypothetical protein